MADRQMVITLPAALAVKLTHMGISLGFLGVTLW